MSQQASSGVPPVSVTVIGLGYVGLTTAVGLASLGHRVTGVDVDRDRVATIQSGRVPIHEPGLQDALTRLGPALTFTTALDEALASRPEVVMIAVQTEFGAAFVEEAARETGRRLRAPATVVLRSTAPLGATRRIGEIVAREHGACVRVVSNPEFLVEGKAYEAFMCPDRIVVGADDDETAALMRRLYAAIEAPLIITDVATAELAKYAANAYLATQISFINEMSDLAAAAGADIAAVSRIIKLDSRVGERAYLNAGMGFGGSCLPKDLRALTRSGEELGIEMRVARAVTAVNEQRAERVVEQLRQAVGPVEGKRVAVWGLAFKGGTNDVRESPAINVVRRLLSLGAHVRAFDPLAEPNALPLVGAGVLCDSLYDPLDEADALMVLTDCREFAEADLAVVREHMRGRVIIDGRAVIDPTAARAAGFTYIGAGDKGASNPQGRRLPRPKADKLTG
jgi:UDPglucose 6-dehydrogenase